MRGEREKGVKSELEETKRQNGWPTALNGKSCPSPLLVNHKGVTNDFLPSETLLNRLPVTCPLPTSLPFRVPPVPKQKLQGGNENKQGGWLQSLQLALYHCETFKHLHVNLESPIKSSAISRAYLPMLALKLWLCVCKPNVMYE